MLEDLEIRRDLTPDELHELTAEEARQADEDGYLAGNKAYRDLRNCTWDDVAQTLAIEREIISKLEAADDRDAAEEAFNEERLFETDPILELWGLDVGVAAATITISALGGAPVSSCNAGQLGGHHPSHYPHVAFYLPKSRARDLLSLAGDVGIGLIVAEGIAQIYARTYGELVRFAATALERSRRVPTGGRPPGDHGDR